MGFMHEQYKEGVNKGLIKTVYDPHATNMYYFCIIPFTV